VGTGYGTWGALDGYRRIQCLGTLRVYTCAVPEIYGALQGRWGVRDWKRRSAATRDCVETPRLQT